MNHRSVAIKTYCTGKKNSLPNQARRRWWWRGRWEGWKQNRNMKVEVYNVFQVDVNGRTITNIWCTNSSLPFVIWYDVLKTQLVLKLCSSSMISFYFMFFLRYHMTCDSLYRLSTIDFKGNLWFDLIDIGIPLWYWLLPNYINSYPLLSRDNYRIKYFHAWKLRMLSSGIIKRTVSVVNKGHPWILRIIYKKSVK